MVAKLAGPRATCVPGMAYHDVLLCKVVGPSVIHTCVYTKVEYTEIEYFCLKACMAAMQDETV
jgi:hypothetical protein